MKRESVSKCPECGSPVCSDSGDLEIAIKKGHVRRASRAADAVFAAAGGPPPELGVVLMTAILLIERLARAYTCDPRRVIQEIEHCFDVRDGHLRSDDPSN
jgi:hypothetical protein